MTNLHVPPGIYPCTVLSMCGYNQVSVQLTCKGEYHGQRFIAKLPQYHLELSETYANIRFGSTKQRPFTNEVRKELISFVKSFANDTGKDGERARAILKELESQS